MDFKKIFSRKRLLFLGIFALVGLIAYQFNFSPILGMENKSFTLFQFFGPIAGAFLGPVFGAIAVGGTEIANFLLTGKVMEFNLFNIMRFTTIMFAALYFGTKARKNLIALVPIACMALFVLHPIGQQAWPYALYWLIPVAARFYNFKAGKLLSKSVGATFTAHAVGSIAFLYTFGMTPEFWLGLIPIVLFERSMFALGIAASYVTVNSLLAKVEAVLPKEIVFIDPKYVISKKFLRVQAKRA